MNTTTLYRIRQKSTGLWYGKKRRYEGQTPWRPRPERYLAKSALVLCLKSIATADLRDCEVVEYAVSETGKRFSPKSFLP